MSLPMDKSFWPLRRTIFDFTLKFEESMFEIFPSSLFLLLGIPTYVYYSKKPVYLRNGLLLWLKLVCAASLYRGVTDLTTLF